MTLQAIISIVFFTSFMIYFFIGLNVIPYKKTISIGLVFFSICVTMSIWSFTVAISNSAPNIETALLWRKLSVFGWGPLYAQLLHFFLIVTENKKILRKKWLVCIMYIPSLISVLLYCLIGSVADLQYSLELTRLGWINQSTNNGVHVFFVIYYTTYLVISLVLIVLWRRKSESINRKTSLYLIVIVVITTVIGTITDILMNIYFPSGIHQFSNVVILIPIIVIYYSIKKNSWSNLIREVKETSMGSILDDVSHENLYRSMSYTYIIASFLTLIASYIIYSRALNFVLIQCFFLVFTGVAIRLISQSDIKKENKDIIIAMITLMSTQVFMLSFIEYAAITVWVAPVILIMISILINNKIVLIMNSISSLLIVIIVGLLVPTKIVHVEASDHFVRVTLIIIFIFMANYINRAFMRRLKINERQVRRQKLIADIATLFGNGHKHNIDNKFFESIKWIGEELQIDLTSILIFSDSLLNVQKLYDSFSHQIIIEHNDYRKHCGWWIEQLEKGQIISVSNIDDLPDQDKCEGFIKSQVEEKSLLIIPIMNTRRLIGSIIYSSKLPYDWPKDIIEISRIIAKLYGDALEKIEKDEEIEKLAYYDSLTNLANRSLFNSRLVKAIEKSKVNKTIVGVFFIDLDSFKSINDSLGHDSGDDLLKVVAKRLVDNIGDKDNVCRFGGDEFLIMIPDLSHESSLVEHAEKLINLFKKPIRIGEYEFFITGSIGVSYSPDDGRTPEQLIKNADMAMYHSKDQGKNCYTISNKDLKDDIHQKSILTNQMYRALERDEFELYYQPQINIHSKEIIGVEALIRWNHPTFGLIPPKEFISIAEYTGLIVPIGEWVIKTACQQIKKWQDKGLNKIKVGVNLSIEQLRSPNLVSSIRTILEETEVESSLVEIEITESVAISGTQDMLSKITELKELGLLISIDDFGTEYSSLNRLKTMPIDRIKMDMFFVQSIGKSPKDDAIVKIIIQLSKSLNLIVIAEGAETLDQLNFLSEHECDEVQGYYYYKPMKVEDVEKLLQDGRNNDKN